MELPATQCAGRPPRSSPALTILLAEGNSSVTQAMRCFLAGVPGTRVVAQTRSGVQALAFAATLRPDLALLDVALPDMGGLEVARHMHGWSARPALLLLSMYEDPAYGEAAHALGALGHVAKINFVAEILPLLARLQAPTAAAACRLPPA